MYNKRIGVENMAEIISGIYKITNTVTGDFYIGSSKDVKERWTAHKCPSTWNKCPNNQMYLDIKKYGIDKFEFQVIEEVEAGKLKDAEQQFIEKLQPTYNSNNAKGLNIERRKEYQKEYRKEYEKSDKRKKCHKEYKKSKKYKKYQKEYDNQLCYFNNEVLTLTALKTRFLRQGIPHPTQEAKKYLLNK